MNIDLFILRQLHRPLANVNPPIGFRAATTVLVVAVQWVVDMDDEAQSMPEVRIISVRKANRRETRNMQMREDVKPKAKSIDPDNPPLTGKEVWGSWGDRVTAKIKAHDARIAARRKAKRTPEPLPAPASPKS